MTYVTAIHAKTGASGKKCPKSGTNIYPDLFNRARGLLPSDIVVGFADTQYEHPPLQMNSLEFDRTARHWCTEQRSISATVDAHEDDIAQLTNIVPINPTLLPQGLAALNLLPSSLVLHAVGGKALGHFANK
ncbi:hypothetical protein ACW9H6_21795 [Pseudomonas sp. SDO528_S397]